MNNLDATRTGTHDRESFWHDQINRWKNSGQNQATYCREQGLKPHQFMYWRKKLEASISASQLRLVPIGDDAQVRQDPAGLLEPKKPSLLIISFDHRFWGDSFGVRRHH